MQINDLIMESINAVIEEGKKEKHESQDTALKYGKGDEKGIGFEDKNVDAKNKKSAEAGLKEKTSKEHVNPQGEGGSEADTEGLDNPKLSAAIVAGLAHGGVGAKIKPNENVKFTPPAPASK